LFFWGRLRPSPGTLALYKADWFLGYLTGRYGVSDLNNCLKLDLDPHDGKLAPVAFASQIELDQISTMAARAMGLPGHILVQEGSYGSAIIARIGGIPA